MWRRVVRLDASLQKPNHARPMKTHRPRLRLLAALCYCALTLAAAEADKPLTNADVVKMIKPGMPPFVAPKSIDVLSGPQADTQIANPQPTF